MNVEELIRKLNQTPEIFTVAAYEQCPCCKSEKVNQIVGVNLIPYQQHHNGNKFKAWKCDVCHYEYHYSSSKDGFPITVKYSFKNKNDTITRRISKQPTSIG